MRPVLIGMNNPLSTEPKYALFPHPPGCTGHRLFKMLQSRVDCFRQDYIDVFERINLLDSKEWDKHDAFDSAVLIFKRLKFRKVVLLGKDVQKAFMLPFVLAPLENAIWNDVCWHYLPHPSGRNHWYNDHGNRESAAKLLEALYNEAVHTIKRPVEA